MIIAVLKSTSHISLGLLTRSYKSLRLRVSGILLVSMETQREER